MPENMPLIINATPIYLEPWVIITTIIFLLGVISLIFGVINFNKEGKKYWLTGGIIGFLLWLFMFGFALYTALTSHDGYRGLVWLLPAMPTMIIMQKFVAFNQPILLPSIIANCFLFFFLGVGAGQLVKIIKKGFGLLFQEKSSELP